MFVMDKPLFFTVESTQFFRIIGDENILESGIDISLVAKGMEMFGASSVLTPELTMSDVVMANLIVITLGLLASLSPAWRASRYQPVEAITPVYRGQIRGGEFRECRLSAGAASSERGGIGHLVETGQ